MKVKLKLLMILEYVLILRNHLCECEVWAASMRIEKAEFSRTLMRPGGVHGQNEHNSENELCSRDRCVTSVV